MISTCAQGPVGPSDRRPPAFGNSRAPSAAPGPVIRSRGVRHAAGPLDRCLVQPHLPSVRRGRVPDLRQTASRPAAPEPLADTGRVDGLDGIKAAQANGLSIAYQSFGDPGGTPILLVMGLGTQMIGWPDDFCTMLADLGHYVARFDNRDSGLSTHLDEDRPGQPIAAFLGRDRPAQESLPGWECDRPT